MATTRHRPDRESVAQLLDADPDHLAEFVECHPDPDAATVTRAGVSGVSPGELEQHERETVAEWVRTYKRESRDDARHRVHQYVAEHEPAGPGRIIDGVTDTTQHSRAWVRRALGTLRRAGYLDREDLAEEPYRHEWLYRTADGDADEC